AAGAGAGLFDGGLPACGAGPGAGDACGTWWRRPGPPNLAGGAVRLGAGAGPGRGGGPGERPWLAVVEPGGGGGGLGGPVGDVDGRRAADHSGLGDVGQATGGQAVNWVSEVGIWMREVAGWLLVALGLLAFYFMFEFLVPGGREPPSPISAACVMIFG